MAGYVRVPHEIPEFVLDFSHGDYVDDERNRSLDDTDAKLVALRRRVGADLWSVTVMLVNGRKESPVKANRCIFQAKLKVSSENNDFVFAESNPHADTTAMDSEEQSLDLLYRHKKIYGTGLGTSVSWDINASGIGSIWSDFFPTVEIPSMSFSLPQNGLIKGEELSILRKIVLLRLETVLLCIFHGGHSGIGGDSLPWLRLCRGRQFHRELNPCNSFRRQCCSPPVPR